MSFVYHKAHHMAHAQYALNGFRTQHLWRNIQQRGIAVLHALDSQGAFYGVEQAVYANGVGYSTLGKIVNLVFHERL